MGPVGIPAPLLKSIIMVTTKFIRLHTKCLAILEMIQTVNNRLSRHKADLYLYQNSTDPYATIKLFSSEGKLLALIAWDIKIKDRLLRHYANTFMQLSESVLENCFNSQLQNA